MHCAQPDEDLAGSEQQPLQPRLMSTREHETGGGGDARVYVHTGIGLEQPAFVVQPSTAFLPE